MGKEGRREGGKKKEGEYGKEVKDFRVLNTATEMVLSYILLVIGLVLIALILYDLYICRTAYSVENATGEPLPAIVDMWTIENEAQIRDSIGISGPVALRFVVRIKKCVDVGKALTLVFYDLIPSARLRKTKRLALPHTVALVRDPEDPDTVLADRGMDNATVPEALEYVLRDGAMTPEAVRARKELIQTAHAWMDAHPAADSDEEAVYSKLRAIEE